MGVLACPGQGLHDAHARLCQHLELGLQLLSVHEIVEQVPPREPEQARLSQSPVLRHVILVLCRCRLQKLKSLSFRRRQI